MYCVIQLILDKKSDIDAILQIETNLYRFVLRMYFTHHL